MLLGLACCGLILVLAIYLRIPEYVTSRTDCESMSSRHSWKEIRDLYLSDPVKYRRWDRDQDGIPCEKQR